MKFKINDVVRFKSDAPEHIKSICSKEMRLINQGEDKNCFNCYTLDGKRWCGSIHIKFLESSDKTENSKEGKMSKSTFEEIKESIIESIKFSKSFTDLKERIETILQEYDLEEESSLLTGRKE